MKLLKFTVKFVLQQTVNNTKETPLRCFVRYNNTRTVFPSGLSIEPRYWNTKAQLPRQVASYKDGPKLIKELENTRAYIKQAYSHLSKNNQFPDEKELAELSLQVIASKGKIPGENAEIIQYNLLTFIERVIADTKSGKRTNKNGSRYAPDSVKAYNSALGVLKRYVKFKKKKTLQFDDITLEFYHDFKDWAYKVEKLSDNYFGAVIKFLKTAMNEAKDEQLHTNDAYNNKRFIKVQVDVENVYLDEKQLETLAKLDLSENKKLERVRDLFLVGCWTGLRFSDFTNIQPKNIKGDFIEIKTQKTGEIVAIPIHSTIREIMTRYDGITLNSLPPAISNDKLNEYIKDLAKEAKFDELVSLEKAKAGHKIILTLPLKDLITTHTARRAFASNMFRMGVPTLVIMAVTGHTTEKAFLKYIKVTPKDKAVIMKEIWNRQAMKVVNAETV